MRSIARIKKDLADGLCWCMVVGGMTETLRIFFGAALLVGSVAWLAPMAKVKLSNRARFLVVFVGIMMAAAGGALLGRF